MADRRYRRYRRHHRRRLAERPISRSVGRTRSIENRFVILKMQLRI